MNSKQEIAMDSTVIANGIMHDIIDLDLMEQTLNYELSSADLFKIDCAILSRLRETKDFSRDLLEQLEAGKFETVAAKPRKSIDIELQKVQQETIMDIALPLQSMFDEMSGFVVEALK